MAGTEFRVQKGWVLEPPFVRPGWPPEPVIGAVIPAAPGAPPMPKSLTRSAAVLESWAGLNRRQRADRTAPARRARDDKFEEAARELAAANGTEMSPQELRARSGCARRTSSGWRPRRWRPGGPAP